MLQQRVYWGVWTEAPGRSRHTRLRVLDQMPNDHHIHLLPLDSKPKHVKLTFPFFFPPSRISRPHKKANHVSPPLSPAVMTPSSFTRHTSTCSLHQTNSGRPCTSPPTSSTHSKGTNLHGVTTNHRRDWQVEWKWCHVDVLSVNEERGRSGGGHSPDWYIVCSLPLSVQPMFHLTVRSIPPP